MFELIAEMMTKLKNDKEKQIEELEPVLVRISNIFPFH